MVIHHCISHGVLFDQRTPAFCEAILQIITYVYDILIPTEFISAQSDLVECNLLRSKLFSGPLCHGKLPKNRDLIGLAHIRIQVIFVSIQVGGIDITVFVDARRSSLQITSVRISARCAYADEGRIVLNLLAPQQHFLNGVCSQVVIRIHHKEKIAICLGDAKVDCTWFPAVLDLVIVDIKSIILVFPLRDQLAGVVGRTIVHDHPLKILTGLFTKGLIQSWQNISAIICRCKNCKIRHITVSFSVLAKHHRFASSLSPDYRDYGGRKKEYPI